MSLNWSVKVGPVVFSWWQTETVAGLLADVWIMFLITVLAEAVNRKFMDMIPYKWRSIGHAIHVALSTFLMLALMSFNGWIILAIILGHVFGYQMFRKPEADVNTDLISDC